MHGDAALRYVQLVLSTGLKNENFVIVYRMLMGHVQPNVLPAKSDDMEENEDVWRLMTHQDDTNITRSHNTQT